MIDYSYRIIGITSTPSTFEEAKAVYEFKIEQYDKKINEHPSAKEVSIKITQALKYVEVWFDENSEDESTQKKTRSTTRIDRMEVSNDLITMQCVDNSMKEIPYATSKLGTVKYQCIAILKSRFIYEEIFL